jgi:hypothetical protein
MHDPTNPLGFIERGWQTRAARELGVDRATICRDVDALLGQISGTGKLDGMNFEFRITRRLLCALMPTAAETQLYARLGIPTSSPVPR